MNLDKPISELLYRYQCVVVPNFGAFLTENVSAQLIENSNSFYPPKKLIGFNANLKHNDGLLAKQIAVSEKCSYENAVELIATEISKWNEQLNVDNFLSFKNIGSISLNADNNMVFSPADNFNFLTTSFGLTSFVSPKVNREVAVANETFFEPDFENIQFENNILEKVQTKSEPITEPKVIEIEQKRGSIGNFKYAAVFLIGCGISSPVFLNLYKEKLAINNLIVEAKVQKQVQNKIQEATFFISNNAIAGASSVLNSTIQMNYHVVAGAFKIEANADKICKVLISRGFKAKKIGQNNNGLYPVIYGSFSNYADANNAMTEIQKKDNAEAWVLIQPLDK